MSQHITQQTDVKSLLKLGHRTVGNPSVQARKPGMQTVINCMTAVPNFHRHVTHTFLSLHPFIYLIAPSSPKIVINTFAKLTSPPDFYY